MKLAVYEDCLTNLNVIKHKSRYSGILEQNIETKTLES